MQITRQRVAQTFGLILIVGHSIGCGGRAASLSKGRPPVTGAAVAPKPEAERPTLAELEATGPGETPSLAAASRFLVAVSQGQYHEAYGMLHSRLRAAVSEHEFTRSLEQMEQAYGKPTGAVPKQQSLGRLDSSKFGTMTVRRLTFALATTLHPPGTHFAVVELAVDGEAVAPLTYQVMSFIGDIPPDSK